LRTSCMTVRGAVIRLSLSMTADQAVINRMVR
jgi:hypothetical protein